MTDVDACERDPAAAFAPTSPPQPTSLATPGFSVPTWSTCPPTTSSTGSMVRTTSRRGRIRSGSTRRTKWLGEEAVRSPRRELGHRPHRGGHDGQLPAVRAARTSGAGVARCDQRRYAVFEDQWVSPSLALNVAEMLAELGRAPPGRRLERRRRRGGEPDGSSAPRCARSSGWTGRCSMPIPPSPTPSWPVLGHRAAGSIRVDKARAQLKATRWASRPRWSSVRAEVEGRQ